MVAEFHSRCSSYLHQLMSKMSSQKILKDKMSLYVHFVFELHFLKSGISLEVSIAFFQI
jgi:hypothetical protein